jgi:isopentenyl-diphosphate delta-isomerase
MDRVQLVDAEGRTIGSAPKIEAHQSPGQLHRAISVLLFDQQGRTLLQRRAPSTYHFADRWSNTCCTHPRQDEDLIAAGARRLTEEMGLLASTLSVVGALQYRAEDPTTGLVESEYDHVLVGSFDGTPEPASAIVSDWAWVAVEDIQLGLIRNPGQYTPWLHQVLRFAIDARPVS